MSLMEREEFGVNKIIQGLQEAVDLGDAPKRGPFGVFVRKEYLVEAIAKLRTHPDNQPNEELTEEDLWGMVGKWVWVTVHYSHCDTSGWAFVCTMGRLAYFEQMLDINGCGTKFVARRRPPKEDQR